MQWFHNTTHLTEKAWHFVKKQLQGLKSVKQGQMQVVQESESFYPITSSSVRDVFLVYSGKVIRCAQSNTFLLNTKLSANWFYQMCVIICEMPRLLCHAPGVFQRIKSYPAPCWMRMIHSWIERKRKSLKDIPKQPLPKRISSKSY